MAPVLLRQVPHFQNTVLPRYVQQGEEEGVSSIIEVLTELGVNVSEKPMRLGGSLVDATVSLEGVC
jgi:hypothetical protein